MVKKQKSGRPTRWDEEKNDEGRDRRTASARGGRPGQGGGSRFGGGGDDRSRRGPGRGTGSSASRRDDRRDDRRGGRDDGRRDDRREGRREDRRDDRRDDRRGFRPDDRRENRRDDRRGARGETRQERRPPRREDRREDRREERREFRPEDRPPREREAAAPERAPSAPSVPAAQAPEADGGKQWVVGRHPVEELLLNTPDRVDQVLVRKGLGQREMGRILDACAAAGVRYKFVDHETLDRTLSAADGRRPPHQGVAAQVAALDYASLEDVILAARQAPLPLILAMDRVQDVGNMGAMARTLYALGGAGLIVPQHETAYLGTAALKASAGALTHLPVARAANLGNALEHLSEQGFFIYAAALEPDALDALSPAPPLAAPAVLVLGNEEKGLRPGVRRHCHGSLAVPLARSFDSLNVAQAAAICMAAFARALKPEA